MRGKVLEIKNAMFCSAKEERISDQIVSLEDGLVLVRYVFCMEISAARRVGDKNWGK